LKTDNDAMKGYMRELELLSMLNHPNIMKLVGIAEHQAFVWHICEFAQFGSLGEMLQDPSVAKFLSVSKRIDILLGVANALHYMHSLTPIIIHRDVKPSNILISHDLTAKLSDFAYSRAIAGPRKMTRCGTPAYVAPEVMLGYPYDESIDTYAFGVVFWQVVTRSKPFASENDPVSILKKTSSGERCEFPPFKVCSSVLGNSDLREAQYERFIELTHLCWHQDRQARPCMMEVIKNIKDYIA
jgi:serine/threonine protein kinase